MTIKPPRHTMQHIGRRKKTGFTLQVDRLTVQKGRKTILRDVSFSINSNEFVVILGPNGAGKTTLLKAIAGERPSNGRVRINGSNLYDEPEHWFKQIGQVPAENVLHDRLPVVTALEYVGRLRGISSRERGESIEKLLEKFKIPRDAYARPIHQLSTGERKKVNICAELLKDPGLLLLDEPTTNLDPDAEAELMQRLQEQAREGTTIVMVSHTINNLKLCDRAIFIGRGEKVHDLKHDAIDRMDYDQWVERYKVYQPNSQVDSGQFGEKTSSGVIEVVMPSEAKPPAFASDPGETWRQYLIILSRQCKLLFYEGWHLFPTPLLVAVAFGLLAGLMLIGVLDAEALVQSTELDPRQDVGDVSQSAFLIGLVASLLGLLGSFREVAREINIYQHERLKGLRVKSYLAAKFTMSGLLYGIVAPIVMVLILRTQQAFPMESLLFDGFGNALLTIILASMAGVALGLAISCLGSGGEGATALMGIAVIANALLSGLTKNKASEKLIDTLSVFVLSRWAMENLATGTGVDCWGSFSLRHQYSPAHLISVWMALLTYIAVALMVAYLALHRKDTWFKPLQRFQRFRTWRTCFYVVTILIALVSSLVLYRYVRQAHRSNLLSVQVEQLHGVNRLIGKSSAARCPPPPSGLGESQPRLSMPQPTATPLPSVTSTTTVTQVTPTIVASATLSPQPEPSLTPTATPEAKATLSSPTPLATETPTETPMPTAPVPEDPTARLPVPADLYFGPGIQRAKLVTLPAEAVLTLLSQAQYMDIHWLRVRGLDESGRSYVGWVNAAHSPLSERLWEVSAELKVPPDCAKPLASTYQSMTGYEPTAGQLGTWVSDGVGEVAVVVDLYRDDVGTQSDQLELHLQLNGKDFRVMPIEPQRKRFLLPNGVYNTHVNAGDRLELVLVPASSKTLSTIQAHVSIFLVPDDCEFRED